MSSSYTGCGLLLLTLFLYQAIAQEDKTRCNVPLPFESLDKLNTSCHEYYGQIQLKQGVTEISSNSTKIHKFSTEGCVQIENTELKDISFLHVFSDFRLLPNCTQFVRYNKKLCAKNLESLNAYFKNIQFYNNSDQPCDECVGGKVSEYYLEKSTGCVTIYGDLIIEDFRGISSNFAKLRGIETINGRLIIRNNTGFGKFNYFDSLKKVGRSEKDVAVVLQDNADLRFLPLPKLQDIELKTGGRVELANNPMLEDYEETTVTTVSAAASAAYTHVVKSNKDSAAVSVAADTGGKLSDSDSEEVESHTDNSDSTAIVIGGVIFALLLFLLGAVAVFFLRSRERSKSHLLEPKFKLSKKSGRKLASLCAEILAGNPMIWFVEDFRILWKQGGVAKQDKTSPSKDTDIVKKKMIPVANNGYILRRKKDIHYKSLQQRVSKLLEYDLIIVIGSTNDLNEVVFCLPRNIGDMSAYEDEVTNVTITFKLLKVNQYSPNLWLYNYEVKDVNKNILSSKELFFYQWSADRLPTDFQDLLRLAPASRGKKAICTSNRRKEAFSLFYLLHEFIMEGNGPQSIVEIFQLHSQFCNGAPLDRHEMLYIMRILLYWATSANCVPSENNKQFVQWCQTYDQMAGIYRKYKNMMTIHPQELGHVECYGEVKYGIEAARIKKINLSERPFAPMKDRFRMKTPEELKKEVNEAMKSSFEKTVEVSPSADVSTFANVSTNINFSKTIEQEMVKSICNTVAK